MPSRETHRSPQPGLLPPSILNPWFDMLREVSSGSLFQRVEPGVWCEELF